MEMDGRRKNKTKQTIIIDSIYCNQHFWTPIFWSGNMWIQEEEEAARRDEKVYIGAMATTTDKRCWYQ